MTLGTIIREYRENNSLSMKDFADKCNLSKGYISMLENGVNPRNKKPIAPTIPSLKKVALGLGIDIDTLMRMLDDKQEISLNIVDNQIGEAEKNSSSMVLTETEKAIITEYRRADDITQAMVLRALDIDKITDGRRTDAKMA